MRRAIANWPEFILACSYYRRLEHLLRANVGLGFVDLVRRHPIVRHSDHATSRGTMIRPNCGSRNPDRFPRCPTRVGHFFAPAETMVATVDSPFPAQHRVRLEWSCPVTPRAHGGALLLASASCTDRMGAPPAVPPNQRAQRPKSHRRPFEGRRAAIAALRSGRTRGSPRAISGFH